MEGSSWGDVGSINLRATEAAACSNMSEQGESTLFVVPCQVHTAVVSHSV